jgi:hypothetical protein
MADMTQSYQNHAHHPKPTYVLTVFALAALVLFIGAVFFGWNTRDWVIASLIGSVWVLAAISRWYIVALQDRIILLEVKVRAAELLSAGQDAHLAKLSKQQIVALRFASDEEFGQLLERAARQNLSPTEIKASIRTWRPDYYRT